MDNDKEIEELATQVHHHNQRYWVEHKPEISDPEYDKLVEKLRGLAPFHDALTEFVEDSNRPKVKHKVPMLSLEKAFSAEEVIKLAANCKAFGGGKGLVATYKIDGLSCSLLYDGGKLVADNYQQFLFGLRDLRWSALASYTGMTSPADVAAAARTCVTSFRDLPSVKICCNTRCGAYGQAATGRQFVTQGPTIAAWDAMDQQMEQNWKFTRGAQRVRLDLDGATGRVVVTEAP